MTLETYTKHRNEAEFLEWADQIGIGFAPKKPSRFSYVLLISVSIGWIFFCCRAVIEVCN